MKSFLDTNVLVYLFDNADPVKRDQARAVLAQPTGQFVISAQVMSEFYVTVTRRLSVPLSADEAAAALDRLAGFVVVTVDATLVRAAARTSTVAQLSYWDALIVESAARAECEVLLTEDLAAGASIRGIRVVNPFESTS